MIDVRDAIIALRRLEDSDFVEWRRAFSERRPATSIHDEGPISSDELSNERYRDVLRRYAGWSESDAVHVFGVFAVDAGDLVGWVDLSTLARDDRQWANLGFHIHNQFHQRGFGSAAVAAAIRHGFCSLGYHRIEAAIRIDNAAAIRTVERAGLEREGVRRRFWRDPDGWTDHVVYAAIAN